MHAGPSTGGGPSTGFWATITCVCRCMTRPRAAAATPCTENAATKTKAPSRRCRSCWRFRSCAAKTLPAWARRWHAEGPRLGPTTSSRAGGGQLAEHVGNFQGRDARADVRKAVRQHEHAAMRDAAARIDDVGHVAVTLVFVRRKQRLAQATYHARRILQIE